jgi:hypothetical protein
MSKTIHTRLSPFDVNLIDYWITGKNDRQTSDSKTEVLLTYQDLYLQ